MGLISVSKGVAIEPRLLNAPRIALIETKLLLRPVYIRPASVDPPHVAFKFSNQSHGASKNDVVQILRVPSAGNEYSRKRFES